MEEVSLLAKGKRWQTLYGETLRVLINGEVKYFKLCFANGLDWSNATSQMVQKVATEKR